MNKLWKKFLTINWKKNILLVWGFLALSFLGVYSYNEINTLTQTVSEGDVMTAEWYNAVNAKLSSEVSASTSSTDIYSRCFSLTEKWWTPWEDKLMYLVSIFSSWPIPKSVRTNHIWFNTEGCNMTESLDLEKLTFDCPSSSVNYWSNVVEIWRYNDVLFCY